MTEEFHVTVRGDVFEWIRLCRALGVKPLYIELSNFDRQLMCAGRGVHTLDDVCHLAVMRRFTILRLKREAQVPPGEPLRWMDYQPIVVDPVIDPTPVVSQVRDAAYYECHVKLDGRFMPTLGTAATSRDLLREERWYATIRRSFPFDPSGFIKYVENNMLSGTRLVGAEYEACLVDTNPHLDGAWLQTSNS